MERINLNDLAQFGIFEIFNVNIEWNVLRLAELRYAESRFAEFRYAKQYDTPSFDSLVS